jgi:ATP-dependent RNA helicase DeaD
LLDQGYASTDICSALIHLLQAGGGEGMASASLPKPKAEVARLTPEPRAQAAGSALAAAPSRGKRDNRDGMPTSGSPSSEQPRESKPKYDRPARTGREPGKATLFLNVGRKQLVTPADIVGKIAGVTRLPADVVGAIDIHQRHTLVDVTEREVVLILNKLTGIKMKGVVLAPSRGA